jgi:Flp pilus assembly protein TadG
MPRRNPPRGWNEGSTAVEAALTVGILAFLIFGIIEFGMALWTWNTMALAIQNAGRYAMVQSASPLGGGCSTTCALTQAQNNLTAAAAAVSTSCPGAPTAYQICLSASKSTATTPSTMTITAAYGFNVIGLGPTFTLTSEATFPLE